MLYYDIFWLLLTHFYATFQMTITKEGDEFITTDETGEKVGLRKFTAEGLEMHMFKGDIVAKRIFKRV